MTLEARGIVLAATPIGDTRDASPHLRELLGSADLIAAEDTRRLRSLAGRLGVQISGRVVSFYDHNERSRLPILLEAARHGLVAVVSDAGQPLVSDPGFPLVKAAIEAGIELNCAPGPSAVLMALVLSGLPATRFVFDGFVPRTAAGRRAWLDQIADERRTLVVFETARRLTQTLSDAAARLGAERPAAIARELTKPHQEVIRGPLAELAAMASARDLKGEITLVIGGAERGAAPTASALAELVDQVEGLVAGGDGLKPAVAAVAGPAELSKRALYAAVLAARAADG
ncbi:MAG: 16S rRNA (cytidine(1402)-2'-O)-methyltransferase [Bifidobacteriaceae bacterium]|jgi:16S rRNA (cytidine1402-2'-O)-methyltransferase|nr:16S rRNA (cytidine(1402)-2'-O)-methyltransferase [Bifidobacteriaceae bacterium]